MKLVKKLSFIVLFICLLVNTVSFQGSALAAEAVNKVTVTFYGDTATTKGFTWYTDTKSTNSDLQVVKKTDLAPDFNTALSFSGDYALSTNSSVAVGKGYTSNPREFVHKAEAIGLKPGTTYYYRVGDAALGIWSDVGTFETAPLAGAFSFIDLADPQAKETDEAVLSGQTFAKAMATIPNAKFIAVNGDWVDTGSVETQWDWLYGNALQGNGKTTLLNTTVLPVAGNHEASENAFFEHFDIKPAAGSDTTKGAYFSVNYRNTHFIVLNNNENSLQYADFTPMQIDWLQKDIAAAKAANYDWIIAVMHKGPYTTSNHATDKDIRSANGVRTLVAPLLENLGVDLVLEGHDHIYARTKVLKNGKPTAAKQLTKRLNDREITYSIATEGTVYVIPSTAGPKVYYKNKEIEPAYYDLFDVADEHHAAAYGADPADATRPVRSQVQNFIGITIDGKKLTAVSYEIDQHKNNAQPYIIDQFGIIK